MLKMFLLAYTPEEALSLFIEVHLQKVSTQKFEVKQKLRTATSTQVTT
jgi:hypothetical protein